MKRRRIKAFKPVWNPDRGVWEGKLLEEHVLREIMERLWLQAKIKVWRIRERIPGKGKLSTPGIPDLMGWIPCKPMSLRLDFGDERATPVFIEVKRPGGARRPAQIRFIEEAKSGGCVAFFAESWADVIRELYPFGIKLAA